MLAGYDLEIRAYWNGEWWVCRACAVVKLGEASVARLTEGLEIGAPGWERGTRYAIDEDAVNAGYQYVDGCAEKPCKADDKGFCPACSGVNCFDCGKRLDTTPEEEAC